MAYRYLLATQQRMDSNEMVSLFAVNYQGKRDSLAQLLQMVDRI